MMHVYLCNTLCMALPTFKCHMHAELYKQADDVHIFVQYPLYVTANIQVSYAC